MFERILVPLDGSEGAERAIPVAVRIARASGGSIVFMRVALPPTEFGTFGSGLHPTLAMKPQVDVSEKDLAEAASYLATTIAAYAGDLAGIATEVDVPAGTASSLIFSAARYEHIDLIVMCSHGETGLKRWILGSMARQAVRHSTVPVLVLNAHGVVPPMPDGTRPLRILVPLDGSALAETALPSAIQLIATLSPSAQGEVHLLRVVELPLTYGKMISDGMREEARKEAETYIESIARHSLTTTSPGLKLSITSSIATSINAARTIIKLAEHTEDTERSAPYDLIAMATHGRGGLQRMMMGSVTERVLGSTKLPLLIVHPWQAKAWQEKSDQTTRVETTAAGV